MKTNPDNYSTESGVVRSKKVRMTLVILGLLFHIGILFAIVSFSRMAYYDNFSTQLRKILYMQMGYLNTIKQVTMEECLVGGTDIRDYDENKMSSFVSTFLQNIQLPQNQKTFVFLHRIDWVNPQAFEMIWTNNVEVNKIVKGRISSDSLILLLDKDLLVEKEEFRSLSYALNNTVSFNLGSIITIKSSKNEYYPVWVFIPNTKNKVHFVVMTLVPKSEILELITPSENSFKIIAILSAISIAISLIAFILMRKFL